MHHTASHVFGYNWGYVDYNLLALYGRVLVLKNTHFSVLMNFMGSFCLFHGVCSNACGMQLNKKHKQWLTYGLFGLHTQMHAETMSVGSYQFLFLFSRHFCLWFNFLPNLWPAKFVVVCRVHRSKIKRA